jgi:hypothetical protein
MTILLTLPPSAAIYLKEDLECQEIYFLKLWMLFRPIHPFFSVGQMLRESWEPVVYKNVLLLCECSVMGILPMPAMNTAESLNLWQ